MTRMTRIGRIAVVSPVVIRMAFVAEDVSVTHDVLLTLQLNYRVLISCDSGIGHNCNIRPFTPNRHKAVQFILLQFTTAEVVRTHNTHMRLFLLLTQVLASKRFVRSVFTGVAARVEE